RFRRRARRRRARDAPPPGAQLPRPRRRDRRRHVDPSPDESGAREMTRGLDPAVLELVDPQFFATLEDLELIARLAVEGFLQGLHRSPYVGFSVEFASHREYLPGDDLRHLNWKLFGRQDKLYVKQYDAETNLDRALRLDWSGSMTTRSRAVSKHRYAACLAAALAHLALRQRDAVGLTMFAGGILDHVKPKAKPHQLDEVLDTL